MYIVKKVGFFLVSGYFVLSAHILGIFSCMLDGQIQAMGFIPFPSLSSWMHAMGFILDVTKQLVSVAKSSALDHNPTPPLSFELYEWIPMYPQKSVMLLSCGFE